MAGPSLMDTLFQRTLDDLIKGLRQQLIGESAFISKAMEEIRREIKATDPQTKSTALQKLSYLSSLHGVDMSWAAFHVVEVMSSSRFAQKKIGYLAASQSFSEATPVLLLITNQLRKDLTSTNEFEVSLALECLSAIATTDLARDLTPDIFTLLSSSKAIVRKKAIAVVLRVFEKYPDAVRVCFKRLVENLDSSDSHTVSAVVGVFCELASQDAKSYLPLAPEFYRVYVNSKNNWVLIKVLKIFAKLAPLEPRLAKRIVEPICEHMRRTGAKSLMFECIRTVVVSLTDYEPAVKLAVERIRELLIDEDPNLKYLGLHALSIIAPKHLWAVVENKEVVIKFLSDVDPNIKLESLRLVMAMVSEDNVAEICRVLVSLALKSDPEFCNEVLGSILATCCRNVYEIIIDFDWYVSLLGEITRIPHCQKGDEIENQLIDIGMRVKDVRPELCQVGRDLLIDPALPGNPFLHRILSASAWICGEYIEFSRKPFELIEALLQPRTSLLPPPVRAVYIQSAFKILIFCLHSYIFQEEENMETSLCPDNLSIGVSELLNLIQLYMSPLTGSEDVEILERSRNLLCFIGLIREKMSNHLVKKEECLETEVSKIIELVLDAFSEEIGPVSMSAQERVPVPDGLEFEENLDDLDEICGDVLMPSLDSLSSGGSPCDWSVGVSVQGMEESEPSNESTSLLSEHRKRHGLYYLPSEKTSEIISDDYPPANEPNLGESMNDNAADLVKLTEKSLALKKKPNYAKPRPVVVKLNESDELLITTKKPQLKDESLSDAVRDVLLGNDSTSKSSSGNLRKEKQNVDRSSELKENLADYEKTEHGNPSSRRRKHYNQGKERQHRSPEKNGGEREQSDKKGKHHKSSHRHSKLKARQRADSPLTVVSQTPAIPDFLL